METAMQDAVIIGAAHRGEVLSRRLKLTPSLKMAVGM
jgi:hypothetical protein